MNSDATEQASDVLVNLRAEYPHLELADVVAQQLECGGLCPGETWESPPTNLSWLAAISLTELGLSPLAVTILSKAASRTTDRSQKDANRFILAADHLKKHSQLEKAIRVYRMANAVHESKWTLNPLAYAVFRIGRYDLACLYWDRSLVLDPHQAGIHSNLGQTAAQYLRDMPRALTPLRRAVALDPGLDPELQGWIADIESLQPGSRSSVTPASDVRASDE